jgi:hypothetical protein
MTGIGDSIDLPLHWSEERVTETRPVSGMTGRVQRSKCQWIEKTATPALTKPLAAHVAQPAGAAAEEIGMNT